MKIKAIHKNDAYYPYRRQLIGLELVKSQTYLVASPFKGYMAQNAVTRKKVSVDGGPPSNTFYFLAVKVED